MKKLRYVLRLALNYKPYVIANIASNIMMAILTVVSVPSLIPFLNILLSRDIAHVPRPAKVGSADEVLQLIKHEFSVLVENNPRQQVVLYICLLILVIFFLKNLFRYLALFFMSTVRNGIVSDLRNQLFRKILVLPIGYFTEERKGDLMTRVSSDVQEVEWSVLNVLEVIFREPIILLGSLGLMLYLSPQFTGMVFLIILIAGLIIGLIGKSLRKKSSEAQYKLGSLMSVVEETLSGLKVIRAFNAENYLERTFQKINTSYRDTMIRVFKRRDLASPFSEFMGMAVVSILLWIGSAEVFNGHMQPEQFLAFLFAFYQVITPSKAFTDAYTYIQKGMAAMDRIDGILQIGQSDTARGSASRDTLVFDSEIRFEHVYFKYPSSEKWVLEDINLTIPKGSSIALVGPSGSGKTTLVDLLSGFYEVSQGRITIDGTDIRAVSLNALRNLLAVVSQDQILFNDTIKNNILFGRNEYTDEEVIRAAQTANAATFITGSEAGYETNIGDRGQKLSGGQRQRLTIARAVLGNPALLILDEATSALDSESEILVQEALNRVMNGRTVIVIAHRLKTVQHTDIICVLQDGKIIEQGSHKLLMGQNGEYAKLVTLQTFQ